MIAWGDSTWSLSELLAALGYSHRKSAAFQARDIVRRGRVVWTGNYSETVWWLRGRGEVA